MVETIWGQIKFGDRKLFHAEWSIQMGHSAWNYFRSPNLIWPQIVSTMAAGAA